MDDFQGFVKESVAGIQKQVALLKDGIKRFVENDAKHAQDLPPIAHPSKVDQMLNGIKFEESVIAQLSELHQQVNRAKKTASKRLKQRTKKIKKDI